ncbi:MAG: DUF2953 domain-containing protein [Clostridia bacterium]|nr:DUF2953 domain-containing protein [Clostridia bacterium]
MILKVIGWILLSVIALVILALFVRVRIVADYGEKTSVSVKWLFLNIPVFPAKKKATENLQDVAEVGTEAQKQLASATEEPPAAEVKTADGTDASQNAETDNAAANKESPNILQMFYSANGGVDGLVLLIKEIFSYLGSFFGGIFHGFVIDELMVDMVVTKSDAAQTAIYYGQLCSTVFPMLGTFVTKYKVKQYDFNITPDFLARKSKAEMHVAFWFRPAKLIGIVLLLVGRLVFKVGFKVAFRMLKPVLASRKNKKQSNSNNNTESGVSNE